MLLVSMCKFVFPLICATKIMMSKRWGREEQLYMISVLILNISLTTNRFSRYNFGACLWKLDPICLNWECNLISFCKMFVSLPAWKYWGVLPIESIHTSNVCFLHTGIWDGSEWLLSVTRRRSWTAFKKWRCSW